MFNSDPGGSMKFVPFVITAFFAVFVLTTTAFAVEVAKPRQVTFLPFGKMVNATVVESAGGVRAYTFDKKVDVEFAKLLVKAREHGATVYTEASKDGGVTVLATPNQKK